MKSNFKHYALFCLAVFPFVACAEGDVPVVPPVAPTTAPVVATKAAAVATEKSCAVRCVFDKAVQFLKNHPFVTCATVVGLGVVAYVAYDLYKTAKEEQEEDDELPVLI